MEKVGRAKPPLGPAELASSSNFIEGFSYREKRDGKLAKGLLSAVSVTGVGWGWAVSFGSLPRGHTWAADGPAQAGKALQ